jgi:quercetin dioxygenase-like cupin family protein
MLHDPLTGQHLRFLMTGNQTGGQLLEVEVVLDPRGRVTRHLHLREDKWVETVEGALSIQLGGAQRRLTSGESVEVPAACCTVWAPMRGAPAFCCRSARRAVWRPP